MKYARILIKGDSIIFSGWHKLTDLGCGSDKPDMEKVKNMVDGYIASIKDLHPDWSIKWQLIDKKPKRL